MYQLPITSFQKPALKNNYLFVLSNSIDVIRLLKRHQIALLIPNHLSNGNSARVKGILQQLHVDL